jgi:RNA polymerase sigma-54 factor
MLGQYLQQKLQQRLSPQQIQLIKLLEVPTIELEERIKKELEENPALEEGSEEADIENELNTDQEEDEEFTENKDENFSLEDYFGDDEDTPDYKLSTNNYSKDDSKNEIPISAGTSFHEYLIDQLGLQNFSEEDRLLAEYIIGNIDDEGYLQRTCEEMCDDILFQTGKQFKLKKINDIISIIHDFEPVGVGARNLQECLILQINKKEQNEITVIAENILKNHFDEFTKRHYEKIIKKLDINDDIFKRAINEITKLNPKPGNSWGSFWEKNMDQITPDFILENTNGEFSLSLNNRNIPELRISSTYSNMLHEYSESKNQTKEAKEAVFFVKQKLDAAKWFVDAIKQRQTTLLTTMNAIIMFQKEYFLDGDESVLRPMIMKDIADMTGYDISTISRVSSSKYIQTDFGIFSLKHFFTEATQHDNGEEVSTREIKNILSECILKENKQHPLTDDALSDILKQKGFSVARRTVTKYREQLNIPVARLRKEI